MPTLDDINFAKALLRAGIVPFESIKQGLQRLDERTAEESAELSLRDVMVEDGMLTPDQADSAGSAWKQSRDDAGEVASSIRGYEIWLKVGEGGMGCVYKARDVSLDRVVALKILPPGSEKDPEHTSRFIQEARNAARLNHENIVKAFDVGLCRDHYYYVMEFVDGPSLKEAIENDRPLDERRSLEIAIQVAKALEHASSYDVVHRDIKPANILLTPEGTAKLTDLGISKLTDGDASTTDTGTALGTPNYISPEQARGDADVDVRSDIYSLGATLYYMVTGEAPFPDSNPVVVMSKHLLEELPSPKAKTPELSDHFCQVVQKMTAKDRDDRYQSAADLLVDLERVRDGMPPQATPVGGEQPAAEMEEKIDRISHRAAERKKSRQYGSQRRRGAPSAGGPGLVIILSGIGVLAALGALYFFVLNPPEDAGPAPSPAATPAEKPAPPVRRPRKPKPPPDPATKDPEGKDMYDEALKYADENPKDYIGILDRIELAAHLAKGSHFRKLALEKKGQVDERLEGAAQASFDSLSARAKSLVAEGKGKEAVEVWDEFPDGCKSEAWRRKVEQARAKTEREAASAGP